MIRSEIFEGGGACVGGGALKGAGLFKGVEVAKSHLVCLAYKKKTEFLFYFLNHDIHVLMKFFLGIILHILSF